MSKRLGLTLLARRSLREVKAQWAEAKVAWKAEKQERELQKEREKEEKENAKEKKRQKAAVAWKGEDGVVDFSDALARGGSRLVCRMVGVLTAR